MDFRHPVEAVIPGVPGRILAVLASAEDELSLRAIARSAEVSPAQASRVLPRLVRLGLVERRDVPPSALFALIDEHVAAGAVRALAGVRETTLAEIGRLAEAIDPPPVSVVVFGPLARGDADADADLDVVLVRPAAVADDDERWVASTDEWGRAVYRLTGNLVEVIEVDDARLAERLRGGAGVWADVAREGITVFGRGT